ncbi:MAG: ATP-binding protein, partial [Bacteroidota bacterium]
LDNALKYSKDQIQIVIKSFEDTKNVVIQISDNGIGISKSHQERIFDKFYRVPTGNLHKVKGFGLGLSYVKKMVEKHGGEIAVNSELNQGSVFTIRLPK